MNIPKFNERTIKKLKGRKKINLIMFLSRMESKKISDFFKQFSGEGQSNATSKSI